jgi:hypothetical protein
MHGVQPIPNSAPEDRGAGEACCRRVMDAPVTLQARIKPLNTNPKDDYQHAERPVDHGLILEQIRADVAEERTE